VRWAYALAATLLVGITVAVPATAQAAPDGCIAPVGVYTEDTPWPQRLLDPGRAWAFTQGRGITVAVLGTGVDATNPQFGPGQVIAGQDLINSGRSVTTDCDGRGTFAAGIIAGRGSGTTTFVGVAPQAAILAIRYTQTTQQGNSAADPNQLAAAIRSAVAAKVRVICVVAPSTTDSQQLRDAVGAAVAADIVVVAPAATTDFHNQNGTAYPAMDDRVLAVAPIGPDGAPASAVSGDHIDLAAPGKSLVSLAGGSGAKLGHVWPVDDPAFAAAYVAGTVALVRAQRTGLTAAAVINRVEMTASRTAANGRDNQLGWGVVNPYGAVTTEGIENNPSRANPGPGGPIVAASAAPVVDEQGLVATYLAIAGLVVAFGCMVAVFVVRQGRARGWRPGLRR
jgi:membrane-anchored mycosin MYCP